MHCAQQFRHHTASRRRTSFGKHSLVCGSLPAGWGGVPSCGRDYLVCGRGGRDFACAMSAGNSRCSKCRVVGDCSAINLSRGCAQVGRRCQITARAVDTGRFWSGR